MSEPILAGAGTLVEVIGFIMLSLAVTHASLPFIYAGLAVVVSGFAFMTPSLNSMLSRWSDPTKQGGILGIGQSISSLARIAGPMVGLPLVENRALADRLGVKAAEMPLFLAAGMMLVGLGLILLAAKRGRDFKPSSEAAAN